MHATGLVYISDLSGLVSRTTAHTPARVVVARRGVLARTTSVAPLARLQGTTLRASWFQARRGLATVRAHVAGPGGDVVVLDVGADVAAVLQQRLADAAAGGVGRR